MLNKVILMGRLSKDPELRTTQSGLAVTSFSLAVERDYKDKQSGEKGVDWIDVVAWRQTAEFVCKYFSKGRMAAVEGKLQTREYIGNDGIKRRATEVVADNVYFADSKRDGDGNQRAGGQPAASPPPARQETYQPSGSAVQTSVYSQQNYYGAAPAQAPAASQPLPDGFIAADGTPPF